MTMIDTVDLACAGPPARLVDARSGVVRRLERRPVPAHFPASFGLVAAALADPAQFGAPATDAWAAGCGFGEDQARVGAALGEAAERYCAALVPEAPPVATWEELRATGIAAVDPDRLALFSAEQLARPGFPFRPISRTAPTAWAAGSDVPGGRPVHVPASLAWATDRGVAGLPPTNPIVQAGLAAHTTVDGAVRRALLEVVERDAMALGWHGRRGMLAVEPPPWLARLGTGPEGRLATRFVAFPNEVGVPVLGALVDDAGSGFCSFGTAARLDPEPAAVRALAEALQLQLVLAQFDDPDGPVAAAARRPGSALRPWRADRAYAASYREDLADVVDYGCHLQLALDPGVRARVGAEFDDALAGHTRLDAVPATTWPALLDALAAAGLEPVAVDLTTADVASAGLRVVRVVVPGCYSNAAAGLPYLGGERLAACLRLAGRERRHLPLPH